MFIQMLLFQKVMDKKSKDYVKFWKIQILKNLQ